jgi:hypothetical protein
VTRSERGANRRPNPTQYTLIRAATLFTLAVNALILARLLGIHQYALYSRGAFFATTVATILFLGQDQLAFRREIDSSTLRSRAILIAATTTLCTTLLAVVSTRSANLPVIISSCCGSAGMVISAVRFIMAQVEGRDNYRGFGQLANAATIQFASIAAAALGGGALAATNAATAASFLWVLFTFRARGETVEHPAPMRAGIPVGIGSAAYSSVITTVSLVVAIRASDLIAAQDRFVILAFGASAGIASAVNSEFYRARLFSPTARWDTLRIRRQMTKTNAAAALLVMAGLVVGGSLARYVLPGRYGDVGPSLRDLAVVIPFLFASNALMNIELAERHTKLTVGRNIFAGVFCLSAMLVLSPTSRHIVGILLISECMGVAIFVLAAVIRHWRTRHSDPLPGRALLDLRLGRLRASPRRMAGASLVVPLEMMICIALGVIAAVASDEEHKLLEVIVLLTVLIPWIWFSFRRPAYAGAVMVAVISVSSHVFALLYRLGLPANLVNDLIVSKDALAWTLLLSLTVAAATARRSVTVAAKLAIFLVIVALIYLVDHSGASLTAKIDEVRSVVIAPLAMTISVLLPPAAKRKCAALSVPIVTAASIYSLVQLALPTSFMTSTIGVGPYWAIVKKQALFLNPRTGLPGNFFASSGFPRLTGCFGDPLSAGEVIGATLVLAVAYRSHLRHPRAQIGILSVALLLTFTRDGWIYAVLGLGALVFRRYGIGKFTERITIGALAVIGCYLFIGPVHGYFAGILNGTSGTTTVHASALNRSLSYHYTLLGSGWGTAGEFAKSVDASAVAAESVYTDLLQSAGYLFTTGLILTLAWIAWEIIRTGYSKWVAVTLLFAQIISGFVSENALTFNGGFLPFFVIALVAAAPADDQSGDTTPILALPRGTAASRPPARRSGTKRPALSELP